MFRKFSHIIFLFSLASGSALFAQPIIQTDSVQTSSDTRALDEVLQQNTLPDSGKVEYISQLTRYGFSNLFDRYTYNPGITQSAHLTPQAESYIKEYLKKHSGHLLALKKWGTQYFNLIDQILLRYGLPTELKYLAVIESNLQSEAVSHAGAFGPWQFMPGTARDYGLIVNHQLDERKDYFKSTHAAARYLLYLYKEFKDWLLVIAAYNGGPGKVYDAIKKSGSKNFWLLQYYLPEESRNHVKKFIATHYIMENNIAGENATPHYTFKAWSSNSLNNTNTLTEAEKSNTKIQTITGKYMAKVIAQYLEMDIKEFQRYNPEFDHKLEMNGQYDLLLPEEKMNLFTALKYEILNASVQELLNPQEPPATRTVYPKTQKKSRKKQP
jgi:membrane-bound lytic murein transglycosylase D